MFTIHAYIAFIERVMVSVHVYVACYIQYVMVTIHVYIPFIQHVMVSVHVYVACFNQHIMVSVHVYVNIKHIRSNPGAVLLTTNNRLYFYLIILSYLPWGYIYMCIYTYIAHTPGRRLKQQHTPPSPPPSTNNVFSLWCMLAIDQTQSAWEIAGAVKSQRY